MLTLIAFMLFVLVDMLSHIKDLFDPKTSWSSWRTYYLCLFSYRIDLLLPFSLAVATTLLIPKMVRSNELIPLLNAGISLRQICFPFFAVAILSAGILWINNQYTYPHASRKYRQVVDSDFGRKSINQESKQLGVVLFPGGSRLFFGQCDHHMQRIDDAFWIRSPEYIVHIEKLYYFRDRPPEGIGVDVIERSEQGELHKTASYEFCELSELMISKETVRIAMSQPKDLSISQLATIVRYLGPSKSRYAIDATMAFYQKLLGPLLAILALLLPLPLCLRYENKLPQPLLVFISLASLFCFQLFIQACNVLVRSSFPCPMSVLLILPWGIGFFIGIRRFRKV
jgi:lipopolysaccharide export LptBFGC system permease protein LptF